MKKPLNVAQRVEILLKEGVENPKKWAAVHGYEEPDTSKMSFDFDVMREEWQRLRDHHLAETSFLFDVIKEMREQILSLSDEGPKVDNDGNVVIK